MSGRADGLATTLGRPVQALAKGLDLLQPLLALGVRIWVGLQFWMAGVLKLTSWDSTLYQFNNEFHVPLLPPAIAAVAGTFGEIFFPILLWLGLFGRFGALGMFVVNAVAVISYRQVLLAEGFEAALAQHVLWGFMLLVLMVYGPGKLSLDHFLFNRRGGRQNSI